MRTRRTSTDSQNSVTFAHDDDNLMLSTVDEGSEESQAFTSSLPIECDDNGRGSHYNDQAARNGVDSSDYDYNDDGDLDDTIAAHGDHDDDDVRDERDRTATAAVEVDEGPAHSHYNSGDDGTNDSQGCGDDADNDSHLIAAAAATTYVGKCYVQLEQLRKRKRAQEENVEALVEAAFGQIDALVNALMSRIQATHAGAHNKFAIANEKLAQNLVFHTRMEKKLRMIASILADDTANSEHADQQQHAVAADEDDD